MNKWDYVLASLFSMIVFLWGVFSYVALVFFASQVWRFTFFYFLLLVILLFTGVVKEEDLKPI